MFSQIIEITLMNLRNVPTRLGASSVIVVGIAGVVAVLISILAMAGGFRAALNSTGEDDRALVLRGGSSDEMSSGIDTDDMNIVAQMEGVELASGELYTVVNVPKRSTGTEANLIMRAVASTGFEIRPELTIVEGRMFDPGKTEIVAGRGAAAEFMNIEVGGELELRDSTWRVVGIFEAGGGAHESELWADLAVAQSVYRLGGAVSSVRVRLADPALIKELDERLEKDPRLDLHVLSEAEFYNEQSKGLSSIIENFGYLVAVIMAVGAIFAALNTMYSAVSTRTVEIATLRAIGFGGLPVVISVMIEALFLALLGGFLGGVLAFVVFNGVTISTMNNVAFSQVAFDFAVTPQLLILGLVWAVALGAFGGLFPAVRAARVPITVALRGE